MKHHTLAISAALVCAILATPAHAGGGMGPLASNLPEQLIQEMTLGSQYSQQVTQTAQQINMLYNQGLNLRVIPTMMWPGISSELASLATIVGNARGLAYATTNTTAAVQAQFGTPTGVLPNYSNSLQQWTSNLDSQIAGVLQQYNMNSTQAMTSQGLMSMLQTMGMTAVGRMQALQAGNQIAGLASNQIQSLQTDVEAGNQAQLNFMSMQAHSMVDQANSVEPILNAPIAPGAF